MSGPPLTRLPPVKVGVHKWVPTGSCESGCPQIGRSINERLEPGAQCLCGRVYVSGCPQAKASEGLKRTLLGRRPWREIPVGGCP